MTNAVGPLLVFTILSLLVPDTAPFAAGRTYIPQQVLEDKKLRKTETCRLARLDRDADEDKNICVYKNTFLGGLRCAAASAGESSRKTACLKKS